MQKKLFATLTALALSCGLMTGCGGGGQAQAGAPAEGSDKISIVCATFPDYDWTRQVIGDEADRFELTYLMGSGVDLHSYQPSVADIATISDSDLFVYVGGESDEWAEDVVANASDEGLRSVSLLEAVGTAAVEEEVVEGMQAEDEHDHEAEGEADHDHEGDEIEYDEHVWLSLRNAQVLVDAIASELSAIDPDHADAYAANALNYAAQLQELDSQFASAVAAASKDTVVFADRFPFRYLVDDYGLSYYAAFVGCSAETEASFETVAFLAQKVDELDLGTVLVIEGSSQTIAQTVVATTQDKDQQIAVMDSLQSVSEDDVNAGKTYLGTMQDNLAVLTDALA